MDRVLSHHRQFFANGMLRLGRTATSFLIVGTLAVILTIFIAVESQHSRIFAGSIAAASLAFSVLVFLHGRSLYLAHRQQRTAITLLGQTEREYQSIFENVLDSILIFDDRGAVINANTRAHRLFGDVEADLLGISLEHLLKESLEVKQFLNELRKERGVRGYAKLLGRDGSDLHLEFTARADFLPGRHVMILRDITRRQQAEEQVKRNLALARVAWSEADAIRNATLAITQDLRMDFVLDAVLNSLKTLVPYEAAQIFLIEADSRLFVVREAAVQAVTESQWPMTMDAAEYPILQRLLDSERGTLIKDTYADSDWRPFQNHQEIRSWLAVPLMSKEHTLGMLSLMHSVPESFTDEHLRLATSLAIPASVAIQNARLYERAAIYSEELERNLSELRQTKRALGESEENLRASDDRFEKVFRASPIAFSITTLDNGTFIDVNEAFERRYGYTRSELRARTSEEMGIWQDPKERAELVRRVRLGIPIRNVLTRLRTKSGKLVITTYSAELIQFDGQGCLLVVSEDAISSASSHDWN